MDKRYGDEDGEKNGGDTFFLIPFLVTYPLQSYTQSNRPSMPFVSPHRHTRVYPTLLRELTKLFRLFWHTQKKYREQKNEKGSTHQTSRQAKTHKHTPTEITSKMKQ